MAETSNSPGQKRAKVDGTLASSSASSHKFDGAARFKSKFHPSWQAGARLWQPIVPNLTHFQNRKLEALLPKKMT